MGRLGVRIEARPLSKVDRSRSRVSRSRAGYPRARPTAPRSRSRAIRSRPPRRQPRESIVELSSGAIARQVSWQVSLLDHRLRLSAGPKARMENLNNNTGVALGVSRQQPWRQDAKYHLMLARPIIQQVQVP